MKGQIVIAAIFSILLFLLLWLRPVVSELGSSIPPNVTGRPTRIPPELNRGRDPMAAPEPASSPINLSKAGIVHPEEVETKILFLTNEERRKNGLRPLEAEMSLKGIAESHSDDMIVRNFFDHVNPDSLAPSDRIAIQDRQLIGTTGENIWMAEGCRAGGSCDPADVQKLAQEIVGDWMKSPGHRANILHKDFTHLGVGVAVRDGKVLATQNFARIIARLNQPAPVTVINGSSLNLATTAVGEVAAVEKFDLWVTSRGTSQGAERPISEGAVQTEPGIYKLRFYIPTEKGFDIYYGPQIEIKNP